MSQNSPILSLPYLQPSQAQKHVTHNDALTRLDALVQTVVADRDRTAPPAPVAAGDAHIVAPGAGGGWAGQDHALAVWDGVTWGFLPPRQGWRAHVRAEGFDVVFDGATWIPARPDLDNLDHLGIATTADATNRLAVAAPATLLSHEGAGHQVKVNKATAGDTASLLFQTAWSGRAEMGTAGSDDFAVKLSADGAGWTTGLSFDAATGLAQFPQGAEVTGQLSGTAVQQAADDTTPGRLMRADWGYGPGTVLGPVGLSGGTPTGAVIERGADANGDYIRFADGTQICQGRVTAAYLNGGQLRYDWTYPRPFTGAADIWIGGTINASDFTSNVTGPDLGEVTSVLVSGIGVNDCTLQIRRLTGATAFAATDTCEIRVLAWGRWA